MPRQGLLDQKLSLKDYLSPTGPDKWIAELGGTKAPTPHRNVQAALKYFHTKMPALPVLDALSFLMAMDLSRAVRPVWLHRGDRVIGFKATQSPFALFFTRRGNSAHQSGIDTQTREVMHFDVRTSVEALESYTTAANDFWTRAPTQSASEGTVTPRGLLYFGSAFSTGILAAGGGLQLIIPRSYEFVLLDR